MPPLLYPFRAAAGRLRVLPDDPAAIIGPRPSGTPGKPSRRPHTDAKVAEVRRLIEQSVLTYGEIAQRTGVGRASICRWTRDQNWQRPLFAPRATDTIPRPRASAKLRLRTLAARLAALAERAIRELEQSPRVDLDRLEQALALYKMAKLASLPRKRKRRTPLVPAQKREARLDSYAGTQGLQNDEPVAPNSHTRPTEPEELSYPQMRAALIEDLRATGVDVDHAPRDALEDYVESHMPARDFPELRPRGRRSKSNRHHASMQGRE